MNSPLNKKANTKSKAKTTKKGQSKKFILSRKQKIAAVVGGVLVLGGVGYWVYSAYYMDGVGAGGCVSNVYRQGSRGSCVEKMQKMLNFTKTVGTIGVDGQFGPKTTTKVKNFQKAHNLSKDGIVGPQTWTVLCNHTSDKTTAKAAGCKVSNGPTSKAR